jgi:hypothetical protein
LILKKADPQRQKIKCSRLDVVVQVCNPSTQEVEAGGWRLYVKTLPQNTVMVIFLGECGIGSRNEFTMLVICNKNILIFHSWIQGKEQLLQEPLLSIFRS